jgi:hypothetical protein
MFATKALPCGDATIKKNPVNETEVHPKIHTKGESMNPVIHLIFFTIPCTPAIANLQFGRKHSVCSAEAAPSGQPASAKVTPFGRNPQSQTCGLLS